MTSFKLCEPEKFTFTGSMAATILETFERYKSLKENEFQVRISKGRRADPFDWEDKLVHAFQINPTSLNTFDKAQLVNRIRSDAEYIALRMRRSIEVLEDYDAMKAAYGSFRFQTGIKEMQDFIDRKKTYLSMLETLAIQSHGASHELESLIPDIKMLKSPNLDFHDEITVNYRFWDIDEINSLLSGLKKQIMVYMTQINQINTKESLDVYLRPSSIELLGLR